MENKDTKLYVLYGPNFNIYYHTIKKSIFFNKRLQGRVPTCQNWLSLDGDVILMTKLYFL